MIIPNITSMDDSVLEKRFANRILGDSKTLRIGNIVSFVAPVKLSDGDDNNIISEESINFCVELPELSNYSGVCFQKIFATNVANILAVKYFKADMEILDTEIVIKKEHENGGIHQVDGVVSLNSIRNINGAVLIYLGLYNKAGSLSTPRAFSLNFDVDVCNKFMDDVNASFYSLANALFLKTAKM